MPGRNTWVRRITIAVLIVIVLAIVSYFYWASLGFPQEAKICSEAKNGAEPNCTTHNFFVAVVLSALLWIDKYHDTLIVIGTFLLAGFVTIQISDSRKSSQRQLRAYIAIFDGAIGIHSTNIAGPFELVANINLKNSGQTPGYEFRTNIEAIIDDKDASPFIFPNTSHTSKSIIGAGTMTNLSKSVYIDAKTLNELKNGTKKIFIWGSADYVDAFGKSRYFIFKCNNSSAFYAESNKWSIQPHKSGYEGN